MYGIAWTLEGKICTKLSFNVKRRKSFVEKLFYSTAMEKRRAYLYPTASYPFVRKMKATALYVGRSVCVEGAAYRGRQFIPNRKSAWITGK